MVTRSMVTRSHDFGHLQIGETNPWWKIPWNFKDQCEKTIWLWKNAKKYEKLSSPTLVIQTIEIPYANETWYLHGICMYLP